MSNKDITVPTCSRWKATRMALRPPSLASRIAEANTTGLSAARDGTSQQNCGLTPSSPAWGGATMHEISWPSHAAPGPEL